MEKNLNKKSFACKFLIIIQILLGVGAFFGGLLLIIDPSGNLMSMPISLLDEAPFSNFLIPGIILLVVLGIIPLVVSFALITKWNLGAANSLNIFAKMHWSWTYSLYIGFALIIWITLETFFLKEVALVHLLYIGIGLTIQAVTLLPSVQQYYSQKG